MTKRFAEIDEEGRVLTVITAAIGPPVLDEDAIRELRSSPKKGWAGNGFLPYWQYDKMHPLYPYWNNRGQWIEISEEHENDGKEYRWNKESGAWEEFTG